MEDLKGGDVELYDVANMQFILLIVFLFTVKCHTCVLSAFTRGADRSQSASSRYSMLCSE